MGFMITKTFRFEAMHFLPNHDGKCRNWHGHSYAFKVTLAGDRLEEQGPKQGMLFDFGDLAAVVRAEIVDKLDHTNLNESAVALAEAWSLSFAATTAEELARLLGRILSEVFYQRGVQVKKVGVGETTDSWATWEP